MKHTFKRSEGNEARMRIRFLDPRVCWPAQKSEKETRCDSIETSSKLCSPEPFEQLVLIIGNKRTHACPSAHLYHDILVLPGCSKFVGRRIVGKLESSSLPRMEITDAMFPVRASSSMPSSGLPWSIGGPGFPGWSSASSLRRREHSRREFTSSSSSSSTYRPRRRPAQPPPRLLTAH